MRRDADELTCRNCGQSVPARRMDRRRWCDRCRREVVRRATIWAWVAAVLAALATALWILFVVSPSSRFLMLWTALVVLVLLFMFTLVRRVAFEIIRGRGVPPPQD